jgi:hypothetical protein
MQNVYQKTILGHDDDALFGNVLEGIDIMLNEPNKILIFASIWWAGKKKKEFDKFQHFNLTKFLMKNPDDFLLVQ